MANGSVALRKIQMGPESTQGTAVAATAIWSGMGLLEDERAIKHVNESVGIAIGTTRAYVESVGAVVKFDPIEASFQELPYIFEAGIAIETPTQDGVGSGYIYEYIAPETTLNTIRTYTIEGGDNQLVQETDFAFVEKFNIGGKAKEAIMMSSEWRGRDVVDTTFTAGQSAPTFVPADNIQFGGSSLAIDAVGGTLGATAVNNTLLSFDLEVTTGLFGKWTNSAKEFDFIQFSGDLFDAKLKLTFEHNASADAQRDIFEAGTPQQYRLEFTGTALATPGTTYSFKTFRIDCAGVYTAFKKSDGDGNATIEAEIQINYDPTATLGLTFLVVNELSALP